MNEGRVLGLPVASISRAEACAELARWIAERRRSYAVLANVHVIETARRLPQVAEALAGAGLVLPDGAPVAWCVSRSTGVRSERVTGTDLLEGLCRVSAEHGYRHFFYGSTLETLEALVAALERRYPGIAIAGALAPPFVPAPALPPDDAAAINAARPDIVWVGLGAPKQDLWMRLARPQLEAPVLVGIGAAFDFASGRKPCAPEPLRRAGLEWLFRLAHEPRRLWRRYLVTNTTFVLGLVQARLEGGRRRP